MSPKVKKIMLYGGIGLVVLLTVLYFLGRSATAETTDETQPANTGTGSASAGGYKYSAPGTRLTKVSSSEEAAELQDRYKGMGREAIISDYIKWRFETDSGYLQIVQNKATQSGISLAESKRLNAIYLLQKFNVAGV